MTIVRKKWVVRSVALNTLLALAFLGIQPQPTLGAVGLPAPVSGVVAPTTTDVVGDGWATRAVCMGCAGAILASGGLSIIGLIALSLAFPEALGGCAIVCSLWNSDILE